MRRFALLACCLSCAEWRRPPTFPERAAGQPVIHEQALVGISGGGDAAVADLLDAEGEPPTLRLFVWEPPGRSPRVLLEAPADRASAVAALVRRDGERAVPLLAEAIAAQWREAQPAAEAQGFVLPRAANPEPGPPWHIRGAPEAGALALLLRAAGGSGALVLLLGDGAPFVPEVEVARMPLAGAPIEPRLWAAGSTAWLLSGSVLAGSPLRRAIGLRRVPVRRGEAELHDQHAAADLRAGDPESARRELDRAIAADPSCFEALYDAAALAAVTGRAQDAVDLLGRAASIDPARVQVRGRDDEDLRPIRLRPEVRALLGLRRLPPEGVSQPQ